MVDFYKILKFTINHILRTIFYPAMIFSGMIHLNEYFEIVKIIFHNFDVFALLGGLEGKKMAQKPCFFFGLIFNFPVFPCGNINVPKIRKQVSQMTLIGRNIIEEYYQIRKITLFEQVQRIRISSKTMKFYMVKRPVFPCGNRHKNRI